MNDNTPAASGAAPTLPSLPAPDLWMDGGSIKGYSTLPGPGPWFTGQDMRDYARAALASREASPAPLTDEPTVPEDVLVLVRKYGDARADDMGWAQATVDLVHGLRRWAAALASPQVAPAPKPLDDPKLQQWFGDAIEGAMAFGFMGNNPPPEGHWLTRFWNIGRAEAAKGAAPAPKPVAWQERQQTIDGWTSWYAVDKPGAAPSQVVCGIEYQWRPLFATPVQVAPGVIDFAKPLETTEGEPVKHVCHDVIQYRSAQVCIDKSTGRSYSGPYPGLTIRNVAAPMQTPAAADDARDAALWREHVAKLDALVTYCPTCCQGFYASKEMTRDEIIFECGKTVGRSTPAAKPAEPTLPTQGDAK